MKDLESFCITCTVGQYDFEKSLCDLGANVNLTPLFADKKLGLGEVKLTIVSFMANWYIKHLRGVLDDGLVRVDKLLFLASLGEVKVTIVSYYS